MSRPVRVLVPLRVAVAGVKVLVKPTASLEVSGAPSQVAVCARAPVPSSVTVTTIWCVAVSLAKPALVPLSVTV